MARSPESILLLLMEAIIDGNAELRSVDMRDDEVIINLICRAPHLYLSIVELTND